MTAPYLKTTATLKTIFNKTLLNTISMAVLGMVVIGCQPAQQATESKASDTPSQEASNNLTTANAAQIVGITPSATAQATIDNFEAEFVAKRLNMQQSQQAEYEALQAADTSNPDLNADLSNSSSTAATPPTEQQHNTTDDSSTDSASVAEDNEHGSQAANEAALNPQNEGTTQTNTAESPPDSQADAQGISLVDLPLVDIPIEPPEMLSAIEIASRYKVAMQSLYLPENLPLPTQAVDTLLNIATLTPEVFNNPQLANRLVLKMPALARMLKQYQIWEQIEVQQSAELQAVKQAQIKAQQEQAEKFDQLVAEFDKTIKGYDEQIAKYEKQLAEFEQ